MAQFLELKSKGRLRDFSILYTTLPHKINSNKNG